MSNWHTHCPFTNNISFCIIKNSTESRRPGLCDVSKSRGHEYAEGDFPGGKGIRFSLEQDGMEVDCAYDGEEALEYAKNCEYDLVLLDVMLPKLDGFQVCQQIREFSVTLHLNTQSPVCIDIRNQLYCHSHCF